jgi:hypothetical protein
MMRIRLENYAFCHKSCKYNGHKDPLIKHEWPLPIDRPALVRRQLEAALQTTPPRDESAPAIEIVLLLGYVSRFYAS